MEFSSRIQKFNQSIDAYVTLPFTTTQAQLSTTSTKIKLLTWIAGGVLIAAVGSIIGHSISSVLSLFGRVKPVETPNSTANSTAGKANKVGQSTLGTVHPTNQQKPPQQQEPQGIAHSPGPPGQAPLGQREDPVSDPLAPGEEDSSSDDDDLENESGDTGQRSDFSFPQDPPSLPSSNAFQEGRNEWSNTRGNDGHSRHNHPESLNRGSPQSSLGNAFSYVGALFSGRPVEEQVKDYPKYKAGEGLSCRGNKQKWRQEIAEQTREVVHRGGYCCTEDGKTTYCDLPPIETDGYGKIEPLKIPPDEKYATKFSVSTQSTLDAMWEKDEKENYVIINMANRRTPGGGWKTGCSAQEESIARCANLVQGLKQAKYPLIQHAANYQGKDAEQPVGIYCRGVSVFRQSEQRDHPFAFLSKPRQTSVISVAAYDLRIGGDRALLGLPLEGHLTEADLTKKNHGEEVSKFEAGTESLIRNMLRKVYNEGHRNLILGALGCGAFQTPPEIVARIFEKVLASDEFQGRFENVEFAILEMTDKDKDNTKAFRAMCEKLTKHQDEAAAAEAGAMVYPQAEPAPVVPPVQLASALPPAGEASPALYPLSCNKELSQRRHPL